MTGGDECRESLLQSALRVCVCQSVCLMESEVRRSEDETIGRRGGASASPTCFSPAFFSHVHPGEEPMGNVWKGKGHYGQKPHQEFDWKTFLSFCTQGGPIRFSYCNSVGQQQLTASYKTILGFHRWRKFHPVDGSSGVSQVSGRCFCPI